MTRFPIMTAALALLVPAAAGAAHPEPGQMERVAILAHQVEDAARHVHRAAERRSHHGDYWEERGLVRLHEFEDSARHFHRQVESYRADPYHTEADFRRLVRSYRRAQEGLHWIHPDRHVRRDFRRAEQAMEELMWVYGYDEGYYDRRYRHPRWRGSRPRVELRWQWWR